jgi:hypothetical protein
MRESDRYRLLGTYRTPRVRLGETIACEARDCDLVVVQISDARIVWPIGRKKGQSGKSLIVFGDLAKAVRTESNQAVCYWWGVTPQTVSKWRKGLGVGLTNPGTHRLRSDYTDEPWAKKALRKAQAKAQDPERCRKIAEARRGKPRPQMDWVSNGIAWTKKHDRIIRTRPPAVAAKLTGHSIDSVYQRRYQLGVTRPRRGKRVALNGGPKYGRGAPS